MTKSHHKVTGADTGAGTVPGTAADTGTVPDTAAAGEIAPFLTQARPPPHRPQNVGVVRAD